MPPNQIVRHREKDGRLLPTHGLRRSPTYKSWVSMKTRCLKPTCGHYKDYGGRGITICPEWVASFASFFADMGLRPEGTTLDRIDNNGNYEPSNCRWATPREQSSHRRSNVLIDIGGEKVSLTEAGRRAGVSLPAIRRRIKNGWPAEELLSPRNQFLRRISYWRPGMKEQRSVRMVAQVQRKPAAAAETIPSSSASS